MKKMKLAQYVLLSLAAGVSFFLFESTPVNAQVNDLHVTVTSIEGTPKGSVGLVVLNPSNTTVRTYSGLVKGWTTTIEAALRDDYSYLTFKVRHDGKDSTTCTVAHNSQGQIDKETNEILISIRLSDLTCHIIDPEQENTIAFKFKTTTELNGVALPVYFNELNKFHQQVGSMNETYSTLEFTILEGFDYTLSLDIDDHEVMCTYQDSPALINDDWSAHYAVVDLAQETCVLSEQTEVEPIVMTFNFGNVGIYTNVYIDMYDKDNESIISYTEELSENCRPSCVRGYTRNDQVAKTTVKFVDSSGPTYQSAKCVNIKTGEDFLTRDQQAALFNIYADDGMKCDYDTTLGWE